MIVVHRLGIGGFGVRDRVADHAHGDPGLVVARVHAALEQALEAVLQLHGAPEFVRGVPARRPQPRGADDRARVPGAIGQIAGEHFAFVGGDQHVVVRRVLGEDRHLPLNLHAAACPSAGRRRCPRTRAPRRSSRRISSPSAGTRRASSLSSGCDPTTSSQRLHCFQIRYCASPSASIERVGAVWITLARQSSSRRRSSGAPALNTSAPVARAASATARTSAAGRSTMKKRTPSASISLSGAIGSSPGASLASTIEKDWSRKRPVVLLSSIAMRAPAMKSSAAGISRIEIVSRLCASWMTPTLTASGSALGRLEPARREQERAKRLRKRASRGASN